MRIAHVIAGLEIGGAEASLSLLARRLAARGHQVEVVSLGGEGVLSAELEAAGVGTRALGVRGPVSTAAGVARLAFAWRSRPPDVVHGWMVHGNLFAWAASRAAGLRAPVVWGLRMSNLSPALNKATTLRLTRWGARLSPFAPSAVVPNSQAALRAHADFGYAPSRMRLIPNGIDTDRFAPDAAARAAVRRELGLSPDDLVFAAVGRFDPQKAQTGFLAAAAAWRSAPKEARFLLCGPGMNWDNAPLARAAEAAGGRGRVVLAGPRPDVERLWTAADAAVSSSVGESFPNAVAEAMACGLPCAATDVGDTRIVLGDTGFVVPPSDPAALAAALDALSREGADRRRARGESARKRVQAEYGVEKMVDRYLSLYGELATS